MKKFMPFIIIFILIAVALNSCVSSKEQAKIEKTSEPQNHAQQIQNASSLPIYAAVDKSVDDFLKK